MCGERLYREDQREKGKVRWQARGSQMRKTTRENNNKKKNKIEHARTNTREKKKTVGGYPSTLLVRECTYVYIHKSLKKKKRTELTFRRGLRLWQHTFLQPTKGTATLKRNTQTRRFITRNAVVCKMTEFKKAHEFFIILCKRGCLTLFFFSF